MELEKRTLFFIKRAADFDVDGGDFSTNTKRKWRTKRQRAAKSDMYLKYVRMLLDVTEFREGIKILDVGCGIAAELLELSQLGADCVGLDINEDYLRLVNEVKRKFKLKNLNIIYGDSCKLPFDDDTFDVVMSFEFFEHVSDVDLAMKEQLRVLKPGGRLIIEQANLLDPFLLFNLLIKSPFGKRKFFGGIKWLFTKGRLIENYGGMGWAGKDEDVHSRLWWKRKLKQYTGLRIVEFSSYIGKMRGGFFKLLEPFIGNILIVAVKR